MRQLTGHGDGAKRELECDVLENMGGIKNFYIKCFVNQHNLCRGGRTVQAACATARAFCFRINKNLCKPMCAKWSTHEDIWGRRELFEWLKYYLFIKMDMTK